MDEPGWIVAETGFDPERLHQQETVFAIGNGYLGTRGAFEEGYPGAWPATLIHRVYDDAPIVYTELANCPNWLPLMVWVEDEPCRLDLGEVVSYRRQLDLRCGVLERQVEWRSPGGRVLRLHWERLASMADPHLLAIRCRITAQEPAAMLVTAGLNGYPDNQGLKHWDVLDQGGQDDRVWLHTRTRQSSVELGMAAWLGVEGAALPEVWAMDCEGLPTLSACWRAEAGDTVTVTKLVSVCTTRDPERPAVGEPDQPSVAAAARTVLDRRVESGVGYEGMLAEHRAVWEAIWQDCDVVIEGDPAAQLATRFNLYHTLIAAPRRDDRSSVPAKTLSGFGYRGHIFWDTEIFILPFLAYTQPEAARNLLSYRYHTLAGARRKAQAAGYQGALFAWESADTGDEVTPRFVPGPWGEGLVRIWPGDIEYHIVADVAFAVQIYWQISGDDAWMRDRGAELVLDGAVFWGTRAEYDPERGCYEITDVIGPDEYHEHVDNNAFTNRMAQWHLQTALEVLTWLRCEHPAKAAELEARLDLTPERLWTWADVIARIKILYHPNTRLFEQFEGYWDQQDLDLTAFEPRGRSMQSILGIEGANRSQVIKQADVLMLLYLLPHWYDRETLQANWDYYSPRTDHTHGSSLAPAIHAILASRLGKTDEAYQHFMRGALVDLEDRRGNTADGIHAASAGGVWQALVFGFGGVHLTEAGLTVSPRLPAHWSRLCFKLRHRGQWHTFDLRQPADIGGVIFDLDGVLTDTSELHYQGWKRLADEEGIPFDRQVNESLRGVDRRESLRRLLAAGSGTATEAEAEEMMARKDRYYRESIRQLSPEDLLPGALDLLQGLRAAGVRIAVGSASKNAREVIGRLGIADLLDAVSDGDSVDRHKPAPDLFLHAAGQLGLPPARCMVVEDAQAGIEAALRGGFWTVGLGPAERVGAAHVVLPDLQGVTWNSLVERLSGPWLRPAG